MNDGPSPAGPRQAAQGDLAWTDSQDIARRAWMVRMNRDPNEPPTGEVLLDRLEGYRVIDDDDDDPVLVNRNGDLIDTWREGYPYDERVSREEYEHDKRMLQIELLKLQNWVKATGER